MKQESWDFFKRYVKGQVILSLILSVLYSLGFGLVGLKWGYVIGLCTGLLSWVPFVGSFLGFLGALLVVTFNFSWELFFSVVGVYLGVQLLETSVLAPRILGRVVGLSFWQSLAAIIIGTAILGPIGGVFAIPAAALIKIFIEKRNKKQELQLQASIPVKSDSLKESTSD